MTNTDYKLAYERQRTAREQAEDALENRSRELYDSKQSLELAYQQLKDQKLQILHQEKLASIGQLSAGVAHEINNPIGFVRSNLQSLSQYTQDLMALLQLYKTTLSSISHSSGIPLDLKHIEQYEEECDIGYLMEDLPNLIEDSVKGTERVAEIVTELKTFSRVDSTEKELLDVNLCIQNTIKLVMSEIKYRAELTQELGDIPITKGYPGSLSQVILNMLVNASHAIPEGKMGTITIRTSLSHQKVSDKPQDIILQIEDNGSGMDEETVNRIFDPFYTTKDVGVGTGLGLSISTSIIKKHGGTISVDSETGVGTMFTICLPIIET